MPEPNPADVASFCEFTGAATQTAVDFLKKYNTIDAAVSQYFEHNGVLPPEIVEAWDEEAFHAGRDPQYGPENQPQNEFSVQGADALNPGIFQPTLSRPPSRVSTYAGGHGGEGGLGGSSLAWGQNSGTQQSGVVESAGQNFRRADREYYDTQNWAMTIPQFSEREYTQNPEARYRAREAGTPVFLKPTPGSHYLPALVTILHAIPMAREAFLAREIQLSDYGANSDWWDGNPIQSSKVVMVDSPANDSESTDLIFETQRLMAFLEQSERAYGSVQNLLQMKAVHDGENRPGADFLRAWQDAMNEIRPEDPLNNIFSSTAVNDPTEAAKGQPQTATLTEFQIPVTKQIMELGGSLYDALDEMVWPEDDGDAVPSVHVRVGEILVARITCSEQGATGVGLDVPAIFYPDRYLESSIDAVQKMRAERVSMLAKINQISETQEKLSLISNPSEGKPISGIALMDQAKSHFSTTPQTESIVRPNGNEETLVNIESDGGAFTYGAAAEELQHVLQRIGAKHVSLEEEKTAALERLREVTRAYREPDTHPDPSSLHRYTLRGVSTDPSVTYVLANPNTTEDLIDTVIDDWQWWRLAYNQNVDQPVDCQKVDQEEVLRAAKEDSSEVLLVYASDNATTHSAQALPSRLRNFVRADNLAFSRDLEQASHRSTPTKRKASAMNERWLNWEDIDEGRQTPVNITVSDDEGLGDPPPYESTVQREAMSMWDRGNGDHMQVDVNSNDKPIRFPDYDDVDLLGSEIYEPETDVKPDAGSQEMSDAMAPDTATHGNSASAAGTGPSAGSINGVHG